MVRWKMDDVQHVALPVQPSSTRPPSLRLIGPRTSFRGVAVAPQLETTPAPPKRGSSVLRNVRGRALPSQTMDSILPHEKENSPDRVESRKNIRRSSFSQVIRELSSSQLHPLDSIGIAPRDSETSSNECTEPQSSPRVSSKIPPRRRSYILEPQEPRSRHSSFQGKLFPPNSLLHNFREKTSAFIPGAIDTSPEKKNLLKSALPAPNRVPPSEKHEAFIFPMPPPPAARQPSRIETTIRVFGYPLAPLYDFWERLQVSHCGQYSVERMLALDEYCQRVTVFRVLSVCILFPFGPLLVIILTECIPLEPVEKGALANYVFWFRHFVIGTILMFCATIQTKVWIQEIVLPTQNILLVAIVSSAVYCALNILVAVLWVFPIPFLVVAGIPIQFGIWILVGRLILGPHPLEGVQDGSFRGCRVLLLTSVHGSMLIIYPAYQAIFLEVDGILELGMIALLPAINLLLKNLQTALGSHLEDSLPEVIIFSVDVFNAIYSVLCMHSANSIKMVVVTLVLNTLVMILSLHGMNRRSRVARACRSFQLMEQQQRKLRRTQSLLDSVITGGCNPDLLSTLVTTTLRMLQTPGQLDANDLRTIRLLSGMPHQLSLSNAALLDALAARSVYNNSRRTTVSMSVKQIKSRFSSVATEGRLLSADHFPAAASPNSKLAKRLRGAVLVVPTSRWLSSRVSSRTNSNENGVLTLKVHPDRESNSTESELSESEHSSSAAVDIPMLKKSVDLSSPRISQLVHATSNSIVQPISSPPRTSKLAIPLFGQEVSDKLIPLVSKGNAVLSNVLGETRKQNTRAVKQTLQLLFNNEYLGLIAYIQCIIPVIYLLWRFSTIYQVAFVLETHFFLLQGRLLMCLHSFITASTLVFDSTGCTRKWGMAVAPWPLSGPPGPSVHPRPLHEWQQSQIVVGTLKVFGSSVGPLYNLWERLQVSHCGQYSVERMLALEEYGQRVSPIRVAFVCILTPLSPLILVVLAAYLPLRHTVEGSDANFMFWLRHFIVVSSAILSGLMQAKAWLSELPLTPTRILGITFCSTGITLVFDIFLARMWVFPVPFLNMLQSPLIIVFCCLTTRLVLGRGVLQSVPDAEFRVIRYFMLIAAQGSLITIYPAYQALFLVAPTVVQPYLMALLTFVNIAMKNVLAACGAHLEDLLPEVIVFTVDVFNALYSALCMRSTNSFKMVAIVVTLNMMDILLALHGMNRRSRVALANRAIQQRRQRQQRLSAKSLGQETEEAEDSLGSLFQATLQLLQLPGQLDPAELRQICLLSCAEHNVSESNRDLLAALAARCVYHNERRPTEIRSMAERKSRYSSAAVSGPDLEYFSIAVKPPSQFMQRLRVAARLIPEAGKRLSVQIGTRLSNSLGFRLDSRERLSQQKDTEGDEESDTDSFDNTATPNDVAELASSTPSRRQSHQPPGTPTSTAQTRRIPGQVEVFSRTEDATHQILPIGSIRAGVSSRKVSVQMGKGSSRKVSVQTEPTTESSFNSSQNRSKRRLMSHLGSSRRLAELTAVSTRLATTLKLRSLVMPENPVINDILKETRKQNTVAVNQTLQLLFNNEYLGLIAYTQCIMPMIYMAYIMVTLEMPNRQFYLNESDLEHPEGLAQRFTVIAAFVVLQMIILIGLHVFVATRFGVSTLYQVSFVLETHARLVQGKIATWLLFAVGFLLEHYGGVNFKIRGNLLILTCFSSRC
ncbi:hypothetical protein P3T76_014241 [Phytophthora citrophthora]|uniref:Transmembrane protein n=1 Tax=Phytophthora citrophthora TaxID=4793 RepID=A0AAD9G1X9_9STRA|nr:hypothetical protein P3T76_014241 [Phytophthora citrophthora]